MRFTGYQNKIVFFSCLIMVTGVMAIDFINPSLPYIMRDLHVSQNMTKGLIIAYMFVLGIAQLFYGSYSENHGRRKAILLSFIIAIAGFIVSALSHSIAMLYLGRMLTALGTAGAPVISRALISDVCHDYVHLKKAFSYYSMAAQFSPALAPVLGGIIQQQANWHWSFALLCIINASTLLIIYYLMPETHAAITVKQTLNHQLKSYVTLFYNHHFMIFNYLSALIYIFTIGYYSLSPFIFHKIGFTPVQNGLFYTAYCAGVVFGALFLSTLLLQLDSNRSFAMMMLLYPVYFILSGIVFSMMENTVILIIIFSFVLAFMCGISASLALTLCMQGFEKDKGIASAVQSFTKIFLTGIVLFVFNFVQLYRFTDLILIFLATSIVMLILYFIVIKLIRATTTV